MTERIDPQDEIIAACCLALDKAHGLLSTVAKYEMVTPELVAACRDWIDGEYNPGTQQAKKCEHRPMTAALDNTVHCIYCGIQLGETT